MSGTIEAISLGWDIGKRVYKLIPNAVLNWRVKRFFGKAILEDNFYIVLDIYEHPLPRVGNRYIKRFHGRKPDIGIIGEDKVLGSCHLRNIKYATSFLAKFRDPLNPINIVSDEDVLNVWDGGFLCFGSADSNVKTFDIENLPENTFYSLSWNRTGGRCFDVEGTIYNIQGREDVGLIVKLKNPRHPEHFIFLCQGLGEWGSSGATYYLFRNFRNIYKSSKNKEFCKVIRTTIGSDESAHEVAHIDK